MEDTIEKITESEVGDVIASHSALGTVAGWLGMSVDLALEEAGPSGTEPSEQRRPQFLGLGAKYVTHDKSVHYSAALDGKLKRRLERGRALASGDGEGVEGNRRLLGSKAGTALVGSGYRLGGGRPLQASAQGPSDDEESSEEEEASRSQAFSAQHQKAVDGRASSSAGGAEAVHGGPEEAARAAGTSQAPNENGVLPEAAVMTAKQRQQLLLFGSPNLDAPEGGGKNKRKKRKKNKPGQETAA